MNSLSKLNYLILTTAFLVSLMGCSSKPVVQEYPATASAQEEITNLENDIKTAQSNQIDMLSPKNFKEARESLDDAKKMYKKGEKSSDTLHEVALGRTYLNNAHAAAEKARGNIEDVIAAREDAIVAGAPSYFGKKMSKVDDDFKDLTEEIEKDKFKKVTKERTDLQKRYLELELMAIKEKNLAESRKTIDLAKKEKANKYAPKTLADAEKSYKDTEAYITANRHNTYAIESRAAETYSQAQHALNINRISKNQKNLPPEELALMLEQERVRVATKQQQLESVKDELKSTQSALDKEKNTAASLEQSREYLEAQKRLEEKYEAARKQFASDEAEVYKQGDALLIRLKGMEFPSAKASITDKNKPLLEKVTKVMEDFGASKVIVEGHTDSIGGKKINDRLSQNRAAAVKEYLRSNAGGIDTSKTEIEAVGYGYQKPLATNKTADGRAQNRRVDIIIKPSTTKY